MNDFETFWSHYPNKKGKLAAQKKFLILQKSKQLPDIDTIIKAIHDQIKEKKYLQGQNQFCPPWKHPSTWLNQGCWTDVCILPKAIRPVQKKVNSIDNLQRALSILRNMGEAKFHSYCNQLNMTDHDKECVLMAANGGAKRVQRLVGRIG